MWLIVGLGNPGAKYTFTRHNVGFLAVDFLLNCLEVKQEPKEEFQALTNQFNWDSEVIKVAKPMTYMNLSGESVGEICRFYKIPVENVLVIQDDLDQPFGQIRLKAASGDGGHNGIKSLAQHLSSNDFIRLKIGIGRPVEKMDPAAYVLQKFSDEENEKLSEILNKSVDAIEEVIFEGAESAMNKFNRR